MTAKFNTAAEAQKAGAALFAAKSITAWCDYRHFGKFIVRVQVAGRWFNMTSDMADGFNSTRETSW